MSRVENVQRSKPSKNLKRTAELSLREYFWQAGPEGNEAWAANAMGETYFMQRQDINSNMPLESIQDKWPFLFVPKHFIKNLKTLTVTLLHWFLVI